MNVKPGDRAIVIKTAEGKQIGAIVQVEGCAGYGSHGPTWRVTTDRLIELSDGSQALPGRQFNCPDAWMRPVSGLPDADENETYIPKEKEQS